MSSAKPPSNGRKFFIRCKATGDDVATTKTAGYGQCTTSPISFVDGGVSGDFDLWTWQPVPSTKGYGFKNVATKAWITPRDNNVVTCAVPDTTCVWEIVDQRDGSSLVHLPGADIIWQIRKNGDLGLGSARTQATNDKKFSFVPIYY